jgi:hypothetical protein
VSYGLGTVVFIKQHKIHIHELKIQRQQHSKHARVVTLCVHFVLFIYLNSNLHLKMYLCSLGSGSSWLSNLGNN